MTEKNKPTKREYRRLLTRKVNLRNIAYLAGIKLARGCADCGYNEHPQALDFDHVRGTKRFNLSACGNRSRILINIEIEKCDVVCSNCHRVRTATRRAA